MENLTEISSIGIEDKDRAVIKSILKLTPSLREKFTLIEKEKYNIADILFINADDKQSIKIWRDLIITRKKITAILVTSKKTLEYNELAIPYPILVQSIVNILLSVIQLEKHLPGRFDNVGQVTKKVLIVDDSLSVRKYMEQKIPTLQSEYAMIMDFSDSGKGAMEKVKVSGYDIVFLDVVMPEVDGYKICKLIKKARPNTHVVMLTSKKSPFDKVRGSMSGCDDYITKPPADEHLKKAMEKLM